MKKYSWEFDHDSEIWSNDTFNTVAECIANAKKVIIADKYAKGTEPKNIYIGKNIQFVPTVDSEYILERVQEQADEHTGQICGDWEAYDCEKKEEIEELNEKMTAVLHEWLRKYGYYPELYAVEGIKSYVIENVV